MSKSLPQGAPALAPIRAFLADRLAAAGCRTRLEAALGEAGTADSPSRFARSIDLEDVPAAALAMMLARAEEGRYADALALSPFGVERRADPVVRAFLDGLEEIAERPPGPLVDADGRPVVFVVSYPRSGNTRFLNIMAGAFPGSRFTAMVGEGRYVSSQGWGVAFAGPVFVKDHVLRDAYRHNPVIYLARDGRDCVLSYNDFKLRRAAAREAALAAGCDGLGWILAEMAAPQSFGPWPDHLRKALAWQDEGADLIVLKYDDMMSEGAFERVSAALAAAGVTLDADRYERGLRNAEAREETLRRASPGWGRERIYPAGSLMDRWLDVPHASKWRALFGPDDKVRLHEAGYTGPLIRAGFEEDPHWWQDP